MSIVGHIYKLQYDDLRKAHTETVVPVTHEDYLRKKKYNNVESLKKTGQKIILVCYLYNNQNNY